MSGETTNNYGAFIWSVADLLRGVYKQSEYGRVILPLTVLRRLDCVLEPTKDRVLQIAATLPEYLENRGPVLEHAAGQSFYNTSKHTFTTLLADPDNVAGNLRNYIAGFSESARDIIDKFNFDTQIDRLTEHNLLYLVVSKFADLDLRPDNVSNLEMGYIYEELIRRFSELSNETAGEHFTPREVIRLMVNLLFVDDDELLTKPGIVKTMLDPACGTGGMLSVSEDYLRKLNPQGRLHVYGQEVNAETYATCRADMLIKGQDASRIRFGNSFNNDQHPNRRFDYLLANPPFGVEWKMVANHVKSEHKTKGFAGRFGAGTPRINDGSFLFLQHMISKMKRPDEGGARLAIVFNGSPLVHRSRRIGRVRDPALDHRERLARSRGRPPGPAVLQHRDLHLLLGRHQPQIPQATRQDPTHRRPRVLDQDAQEPRQQTQADQRRTDRRTHPPLRRLRGRPEGQDLPQTRASGSYASPSNVPYNSAGRSPTTPSPPPPTTRRSPSSHP